MKTYSELPDGTYVELVRSLLGTALPTGIMSSAFLGIGMIVIGQSGDPLIAALVGLGGAASVVRLGILARYRSWAREETIDRDKARRIEFVFALGYLAFAVVLGGFGVRAVDVAPPGDDMLVTGLLIGYGAGVAAGAALRPWISSSAMLIAILPTIAFTSMKSGIAFEAMALLMAALLAGGINSLVGRYRSETSKINMRRLFATLARQDHLTGLSNRLSLSERFDQLSTRSGSELAVYCLDLDRFKPVNDSCGHPVGDALLRAVAERLERALRGHDFAARTGGDEFVIIQVGINHPDAADMFARRIARAIAEPYQISDQLILISTSIGYALSVDCGFDLGRLLVSADEALCRTKRIGGGKVALGRCVAENGDDQQSA